MRILTSISCSLIYLITLDDSTIIFISDMAVESDGEEERWESPVRFVCVVYLTKREFTWRFLPFRHAIFPLSVTTLLHKRLKPVQPAEQQSLTICIFLDWLLNQSSVTRFFQYFFHSATLIISSLLSLQFLYTFIIKLGYFHYNFII